MRSLFTTLFASFLVSALFAQSQLYLPDNSMKVYAYGQEQTLAWCGGFNNPQFSMGDLNNDGLKDLIVFESYKGIKTFINKGTASTPDYRYAPEYALNFPPVYDYLILADYNCDNIPDLFHEGSTGFEVYRGYYNTQNQLCFTFYQDLFYTNDLSSGGPANAFNNPGDIPAIVDVDGDGDLDFISYDILGGTLNYYKNMRVELGLPCDSIHIELKDRCWGKVYQGFYRTHVLNHSCDNSGLLRSATGNKKNHQGNTPCLFDWDMDGDYDYLDGSISFNEMTFLKNGRMEFGGHDSMVSQDTMWQTGGKQIELPVWPAAFNVDINTDGKKDLLISPNATNGSENYKCIWYYQNNSTPGVPNWQFKSDTFLIDKTIDVGTAAYPALFDFNKDGKPDLFVGSDGYYQSSGLLRSKISYYQNTSTPGNPSFTLQTKDFLNIDSFNYQGTSLTFGDIDNDGKSDMLIGHTDGTISYFKNTASLETVAPNWHLLQAQMTDMTGTIINVSGHAAPFIYDVDHDGKPDLVIGSEYGYLQYYQNVSTTPGVLRLKLVNNRLGGAKADPNQLLSNYSKPFIGKIDSTGVDYLLLGSNSGNIYQYGNISSGDTTAVYNLITAQYSFIDSTNLVYNHPSNPYGVYGGLHSAPVVGDVDGDGNYEMLVGDFRGGITFYKRKEHADTEVPTVHQQADFIVFPNPASNHIDITWVGMSEPSVQVSVFNIQGQKLYSTDVKSGFQHTSIPVSLLPSGVYVCELANGGNKYYNKFTIVH